MGDDKRGIWRPVIAVFVALVGLVTYVLIDNARVRRLSAEEQGRVQAEMLRSAQERDRLRQEAAAQAEVRRVEEQEDSIREVDLERHKANVAACTEAAAKYLPWSSVGAKAKIEADCAEKEARLAKTGN